VRVEMKVIIGVLMLILPIVILLGWIAYLAIQSEGILMVLTTLGVVFLIVIWVIISFYLIVSND